VKGPRATIGDQNKVADIEAPLGGDAFYRIGHCRRRYLKNAVRGGSQIHVQRFGKVGFHGAFRCRDIQRHLAAEEPVWVQPAKQQVRVRHGRFVAAVGITGRTRNRPSTLRSNMQRAIGINPRDGSAAGDYVWGGKYTSRIDFNHGGGIHGDLFAVQASDDVALNLLQHQLNRLG
jgi:hypothetical protein